MQIGDVGTADYSLFSPKIKHKSVKSIYNEGGLILFSGTRGGSGDNMQMNRLQTLIMFCFCLVFSAAHLAAHILKCAASGVYTKTLSAFPYLVTLTEKAGRQSVLDIIQTY